MTRNPDKRRCSHPSCHSWALRGGTLCNVHAGRVRQPPEIAGLAEPAPEEWHLPTLESEIALLAARRDFVDRKLRERLDDMDCGTSEALRYLAVLSQVGKSLAVMIAQRAATGGAAELERFFEAVSERVRELQPASEGATENEDKRRVAEP